MTTTLSPIVSDQIWELGHEIRMLPGVFLPARMLVVRLEGSDLALWSPVPFDDEIAARIDALGQVTTLIAPNDLHHLYLRPAMERYPQAETWAAPGLPAKRPELGLERTLGPGAEVPFAKVLAPIFLHGSPKSQETAFLHRPTRTLILTDALFNLRRVRGFLSPLMFRLTGSIGAPVQSRLWRSTVQDKGAMGRSIAALLEEDFERIVMAHGEVVPSDGPAVLRSAASWLPGI
ncbi:MAG: DUF4336 domain-containing protein [Deltaproteobacteria bacterium]|nr:MAG: DUF4336 domain-containing protein [Deltaproteobacteria bacterium]